MGEMLGVSCSWNDEVSSAIQSGCFSRSATSASGVPMLPGCRRRGLAVGTGDGHVALMGQEMQRHLQLPDDRHPGVARGGERRRVGRNARARNDECALRDAHEIVPAALHGDAELFQRRRGMIHGVTRPRVARVDVRAGAAQELGRGAPAAREPQHADLAARPRGRQRFGQGADWHLGGHPAGVSEASECRDLLSLMNGWPR